MMFCLKRRTVSSSIDEIYAVFKDDGYGIVELAATSYLSGREGDKQGAASNMK